jgi:hypothetical protein
LEIKKREHLHNQDPASILCPKRGSVRAQTAQEDLEQLGMVLDVLTGSWSFKESLPTCYIWLKHMLTLHVVTTSKSEAPAEDTPCSRTVSILRDLNNVPSRYCSFEFLIL